MANSIKIKRSAVAAKVPLTTDLALGELAINTYDGKLYMKKDDGTESIVTVNTGGAGSGDVVGPGSSTDNAITRFDGATGLLIQNSTATLDDSGVLSVSGANISGLIASYAVATDGSSNLVSVANTGTGDNVLATSPTLITPALGTPTALVGTNISGTASGLSIGGNAETVTGGVYTTDTSTVTNTMLAGSIANSKLVNSNITINGSVTALGGSVNVGTVTSVTGTSPISSTGGAAPDISISAAGTATSGYLSSTDWNTFNDKGDGAVVSITGTANEIDVSSPTGAVTLSLPATINADTTGSAATLTTARNIAGVSFNGSAAIDIPLSNLNEVTIGTPLVNQVLRYNGTAWANANSDTSSAGTGVVFYNATPNITPVGANNAIPISTFATIPVTTAEVTITGTAVSDTTCFSAFVSAPLGRTVFDAGIWDFTIWAGVDSVASGSITTITRQIYTAIPLVTGTITTTGTGTSRTATASAGIPFAAAVIDASASVLVSSYLQTPNGIYQITGRTSDTEVTIATLSGYTNESAVAGTVWKKLFGVTTPSITSISPDYSQLDAYITQPSTAVTIATRLGILGFVTSDFTRTITLTYNGTERNTHVNSPLANLHNDLAGLNGGSAGEYYHSTAAEYTGTGTGVFVRATSPTLVTPALGTPTALVGTNISGTAANLTAGHVTTNANLTGPITSVGNATSIASQTGTGTKFVVDTSPVLVTPNLGTPSAGTLTNCTFPTLNQDTTGTAAKTNALNSATTVVNVSSATAPTVGQYLIATSSTAATWQTPPAAGGFPAGTAMVFRQTAAPTGWTKVTASGDNSALRVVTGATATGGSVAFTTAFSSQAVSGTNGVSGATTLATAQIPAHSHTSTRGNGGSNSLTNNAGTQSGSNGTITTNNAGGGTSHTHPAGTFTGTAINLAVLYVDVIIAIKD